MIAALTRLWKLLILIPVSAWNRIRNRIARAWDAFLLFTFHHEPKE